MAITQIAADIFAIDGLTEDGAEFILDCSGAVPTAGLFPFLGGVPDASMLSFRPYLEPGATLGPRVDLPYGFRWNITGGATQDGFQLYIVDTQSAKVQNVLGDTLADYHDEGWQFFFRWPKALTPAFVDGELRIKKFLLGGDHSDYIFARQPHLLEEMSQTQIDERGCTRLEHIVESWQIGHKWKQNTVRYKGGQIRDDYKGSKAGGITRPYLYLLDGATVLATLPGKYTKSTDPTSGDPLGTKVFDEVALLALMAAHPTYTHTAVDSTYGHTAEGGSGTSTPFVSSPIGNLVDGGVVNSLHSYRSLSDDVNWSVTGALYQYDTVFSSTDALLAGSGFNGFNALTTSGNFDRNASGRHNWCNYTSGNPTVVAGKRYTIFFNQIVSGAGQIKYDSGMTDWAMRRYSSPNPGNPPNDPIGVPVESLDWRGSMWVDYTLPSSPPTTTNVAVTEASIDKVTGTSTLSADMADDDHTISAAEAFPGDDLGEDYNTNWQMVLGAGTTSREATLALNSMDIPVGAVNTLSVRGEDETDGWGAVDTVPIEVTLDAAMDLLGLDVRGTGTRQSEAFYFRLGQVPRDGVVRSVSVNAINYNNQGMALYTGSEATPDGGSLVAGSDTSQIAGTGAGWQHFFYSAKPAVTATQWLWVLVYRDTLMTISETISDTGERYYLGPNDLTEAPATASVSTLNDNKSIASFVIVEPPAVGGGIVGLMGGVGKLMGG